MSSILSFFTSQEEHVQQEFDLAIQPLRSRKWIHFNWSHILFIDGAFHPTKCLQKETFREILQHNDMEMLINQIFSLMYVSADRCKESVSQKAQLTLRNGLVLIYQMMKNYVTLFWEGQQHNGNKEGNTVWELDPPCFSNDFYKNILRILLLVGDEKVFRPDVIEVSNYLFAFLLNDRLYGPLFLMYINDLRSRFSNLII